MKDFTTLTNNSQYHVLFTVFTSAETCVYEGDCLDTAQKVYDGLIKTLRLSPSAEVKIVSRGEILKKHVKTLFGPRDFTEEDLRQSGENGYYGSFGLRAAVC